MGDIQQYHYRDTSLATPVRSKSTARKAENKRGEYSMRAEEDDDHAQNLAILDLEINRSKRRHDESWSSINDLDTKYASMTMSESASDTSMVMGEITSIGNIRGNKSSSYSSKSMGNASCATVDLCRSMKIIENTANECASFITGNMSERSSKHDAMANEINNMAQTTSLNSTSYTRSASNPISCAKSGIVRSMVDKERSSKKLVASFMERLQSTTSSAGGPRITSTQKNLNDTSWKETSASICLNKNTDISRSSDRFQKTFVRSVAKKEKTVTGFVAKRAKSGSSAVTPNNGELYRHLQSEVRSLRDESAEKNRIIQSLLGIIELNSLSEERWKTANAEQVETQQAYRAQSTGNRISRTQTSRTQHKSRVQSSGNQTFRAQTSRTKTQIQTSQTQISRRSLSAEYREMQKKENAP